MPLKIRRLLEGKKVILASQSPRRKELFKLICQDFEVCPALGEEKIPDGIQPEYAAETIAAEKCREAAQRRQADVIVACDTVVLLDGEIMGKPADPADAARMLGKLSGRTHRVISGTAFMCGGRLRSFSEITEVTFRNLTDQDIADYIETGEPFDKAGAYGIQGTGALLVSGISGDYFNVVGLPVSKLASLLERFV
ncbi:Maf family protein [Ruminococcus sp. Marseille-P6503]|uniref:Maf family protein n=1 Tax=Ruminococcus sp. Marseille-P6503 TaxID=2364796 RepID=UPI000F521CB0|nr:Maf family protein [Ruminococcus sp. Marseille-P6503]